MTRIVDGQQLLQFQFQIGQTRNQLSLYTDQLSSGLRVKEPGDDFGNASSISQLSQTSARVEEHLNRLESARGHLTFQDGIISSASDLVIRLKEVATQAANETLGTEVRAQMAEEVFQIRDALVGLANSQYQGRYIFGGADDDDPPYDAATYTNPSTGSASQRYVFDAESGTSTTRNVQITDDFSMRLNSVGNTIFDNAIQASERLGRALSGYQTLPASGAPTGAGAAYTFPTDYSLQTTDIQSTITLMDTARRVDLSNERTSIAGRLTRLDTAESILESLRTSVAETTSKLQAADTAEAASLLTDAQTRYQASLRATSIALNLSQSILDLV